MQMILIPAMRRRTSRPPIAMATIAPIERPVWGVYVDTKDAEGVVMFVDVFEKGDPAIEIVLPATGCC